MPKDLRLLLVNGVNGSLSPLVYCSRADASEIGGPPVEYMQLANAPSPRASA